MRYYMYSNGKAATLLIIDATALCIWQGSLMHNSQNLFWVYMHTLEAYLMNLCLKAVSMLCCAWLQASKPPLWKNISAFPCTTRHSIFGWSEKKAANRWYPFWLKLPEKLDVYHKKTESWKDIDWQSEGSCSDNILSYPPFYPPSSSSSLLLFLMQWPKPMITRLLLLFPSPKTASLLQLIDPYIEENASSSSSWHSSDKYWGLENRKSCPILESFD